MRNNFLTFLKITGAALICFCLFSFIDGEKIRSVQADVVSPKNQAVASAPIIINHTTTDLSKIPTYWIDQAKNLYKIAYGHTSHGSQLITGIEMLDADGVDGINGTQYDTYDDFYYYKFGIVILVIIYVFL